MLWNRIHLARVKDGHFVSPANVGDCPETNASSNPRGHRRRRIATMGATGSACFGKKPFDFSAMVEGHLVDPGKDPCRMSEPAGPIPKCK